MLEKERTFKNVIIDTDFNSAHITLDHHGEFIVNTPEGKEKLVFVSSAITLSLNRIGEDLQNI